MDREGIERRGEEVRIGTEIRGDEMTEGHVRTIRREMKEEMKQEMKRKE